MSGPARGPRARVATASRNAAALAVDVANDGAGRLPIAREGVAELARQVLAAERVGNAMLSIAFLTPRAMAALNRKHLGHAGATDVISFGFAASGATATIVGDIYICPSVARANARAHGNSVREEVARLVVHGTLHILGHEHPTDDARTGSRMWRRQESLLARLFRGSPSRTARRT